MFNNLRADIQRHSINLDSRCSVKNCFYLFLEQGIWAIVVFRFGRWVHLLRIPIIRLILKIVSFSLFKITEVISGISIPASVEIGKGFYIGHFGGVIIHSRVKIGDYCSIGPGVIIGTRGLRNNGVPIIGNNVYIGVGAKLLGNINIGNNVRIGANAVVLIDIPDNATAVGIPAKVVKINNCNLSSKKNGNIT